MSEVIAKKPCNCGVKGQESISCERHPGAPRMYSYTFKMPPDTNAWPDQFLFTAPQTRIRTYPTESERPAYAPPSWCPQPAMTSKLSAALTAKAPDHGWGMFDTAYSLLTTVWEEGLTDEEWLRLAEEKYDSRRRK